MKRREFVKAAGVIAAGTAAAHDLAFGKDFLNSLVRLDKKPNIIFILADDLGIGNVSCYGADWTGLPCSSKLRLSLIVKPESFSSVIYTSCRH